jgi:predicted short-subunit dehydrogenase-like oxidoreductase (DUF2520 family)
MKTPKPVVAIIGSGSLATFLAVALHKAGFTISEVVTRDAPSPASLRRARVLARKIGAHSASSCSATLDADLLWLCVPDREIPAAASALAISLASRWDPRKGKRARFAFHSSGALLARELAPLRRAGSRVASVHPLMTFVPGAYPSLSGVPFALEGDASAVQTARQIVRKLGGESFLLPAKRKAAYHAWATMTSPLFLAFLVTLEEAASAAGLKREDARHKSLPIIRQTLANYSKLSPGHSFSGPLIRGDVDTVARHMAVLKKHPVTRKVYVSLAQAALCGLPVKNRKELERLLRVNAAAAR